jgi:hypothetical protein
MTDGQLSLPFPTAKVRCPTRHGNADVYYLAGRPDVVGAKRVVCPTCAGKGRVLVPVQINEQPG